MTYGRSHRTPRRGQSWGQRPPPPFSAPPCWVPFLVLKLGWAVSLLTSGPSCTCYQTCRVGIEGFMLEKDPGRKEEDEMRGHLAPDRWLVCAPNWTQAFSELFICRFATVLSPRLPLFF